MIGPPITVKTNVYYLSDVLVLAITKSIECSIKVK